MSTPRTVEELEALLPDWHVDPVGNELYIDDGFGNNTMSFPFHTKKIQRQSIAAAYAAAKAFEEAS